MDFIGFCVRRTASAVATLLLASMLIFAAAHALPGGYADVFLGAQATPEAKARIEARFGLDRPAPERYAAWLGAAVAGDFGVSYVTQKPVAEEFAARLPVTAQIATVALIIAVAIGLPLGVAGGYAREGARARVASRLVGSLAMSVPDFLLGALLLWLATGVFGGAGVGGWVPPEEGWLASLGATILPAVSLAGLGVGFVMTSARHAAMTARNGAWVLAAEARGTPAATVMRRHVLRNAAIPVVTAASIYFGFLLGGAAIVESTFTLPGVGRYVLQAVALRDYPVVQAAALVSVAAFIAVNLAADVAYAALDPRIRAG